MFFERLAKNILKNVLDNDIIFKINYYSKTVKEFTVFSASSEHCSTGISKIATLASKIRRNVV